MTKKVVYQNEEFNLLQHALNIEDGLDGLRYNKVIVATDAPLLPHQLKRIAQRVPLGIGQVGGLGHNASGDIFLAFSTAQFLVRHPCILTGRPECPGGR